jgi:DNA gyrase subunit B
MSEDRKETSAVDTTTALAATPPENGTPDGEEYNPESVDVLRDAAHIRQRPGMYIGDTGSHGLHHLVHELVANSVDEALAGFCKNIHVRIHNDGGLSVADDGRGIPVEEHPKEKLSTLEVVMTKIGAGAKFGKGTYKVSAGLHGMGAKAVTALSEWSEAQVQRNGRTYRQEYERGQAITPVEDIGPAKHTGTRVSFKPDPEIFHDRTFSYEELQDRLRELAFLNKGLTIALHDERTGKEETFVSQEGLAEFVRWINRASEPLHEPIYIDKIVEHEVEQNGAKVIQPIRIEIAMQYTDAEEERVRCYTNNAFNSIGGTHLIGFRTALTRSMNAYGKREELFKKDELPKGEDYRDGLTVVISVHLPEPQFDSQEKKRLNNLEVEGIVETVVNEALSRYVEEHPKEAQRILKKVEMTAEARMAAKKAKDAITARKNILSGGGLPGKLFDCNGRSRDESELFLVEGDSAGGSAVEGRSNEFQAILPLRGKPLNVEKARLENMLKNEEISSLISAIGVDIGSNDEESLKNLRYNKVVIMTDADVDGQHIRTLLLTFFYRQMPQLVAKGHVYVARPPLYKVTQKKSIRFIQTGEEMQRELTERGLDKTALRVLPRVEPGAEALPPTAGRTVQAKDLAGLMPITTRLEDALENLERAGINLTEFIKRVNPERGLPFHRVRLGGSENWFWTREEVESFRVKEGQRLGRELVIGEETEEGLGAPAGQTNGNADTLYVRDFPDVRKVNRALDELRRFGLDAADLVPAPRVAGREPLPRLVLEHEDQSHSLTTLRDLVAEIRHLGERGLSITRFKGLGEMDPLELWDTTLDPQKRILMRIQLEDAMKADEMFSKLMGEPVEPRRQFIQAYARQIKAEDLDYHGA